MNKIIEILNTHIKLAYLVLGFSAGFLTATILLTLRFTGNV